MHSAMIDDDNRPKVRFAGSGTGFHAEVKRRVDAYFQDQGISRRGNVAMALKSAFWFGLTALLWSLVVFGGFSASASLLLVLALGFSLACIGFNVGHAMQRNKLIYALADAALVVIRRPGADG